MSDWTNKGTPEEKLPMPSPWKKNSYVQSCRLCAKILNFALIFLFLTFGVSFYRKDKLPIFSGIKPELKDEPLQEETDRKQFTFEYRKSRYVVTPQAEYEIKGLLVSHNDITAWWDMYHNKDSVDIKDVCLVWGDNISTNVYQRVKFYNESVSCHYTIKDQETQVLFNPRQLSNNHLLSDSQSVRDTIQSMAVGDQIYLKGMLVNYYPEGLPDYVRKSSLTRKDTGGGACEVFFVNDARIISKSSRTWLNIFGFAQQCIPIALALRLILFLVIPWLEFRFE